MHLSIHLCPKSFDPTASGPIHIVKDVYKEKTSKSTRHNTYALITVHAPVHKPRSLEFAITRGYTTVGISDTSRDSEISKGNGCSHHNLKSSFDETNAAFYIGNLENLFAIHVKKYEYA